MLKKSCQCQKTESDSLICLGIYERKSSDVSDQSNHAVCSAADNACKAKALLDKEVAT